MVASMAVGGGGAARQQGSELGVRKRRIRERQRVQESLMWACTSCGSAWACTSRRKGEMDWRRSQRECADSVVFEEPRDATF
jgi:hypothetical protein